MNLLSRWRAWIIKRDEERYAALREYRAYQIEQAARIAAAVLAGFGAALSVWNAPPPPEETKP